MSGIVGVGHRFSLCTTRPSKAIVEHDLARLPPDVLPHGRERHIVRQNRIVAQDIPEILWWWAVFVFVFVCAYDCGRGNECLGTGMAEYVHGRTG